GNGSPDSSKAACSVTAGRPNGHRTATRRKARGGRPSWRSTSSRSSTRAGLAVDPGRDALHDEQPLPAPDEPEPPRLPLESLLRRRVGESPLQLSLLRLERLHVRDPIGELPFRAQVAPAGTRVQEGDQQDR